MRGFLILLVLVGLGRSLTAAPGSVDPTLGPGLEGSSDWVNCLAIRPDGRILMGGPFTFYKGVSVKGMVEIYPDGSIARTFSHPFAPPNYYPERFALQPDGKVLVLGSGLVRLNQDGTPDASFALPASSAGRLTDVVLQPDGKILLAGEASTYAANPLRKGITRLNPDGSVDGTFNAPNPSQAPRNARSIALQPDGKIIVAGLLFEGDPSYTAVCRLHPNGALDSSFQWGTGQSSGADLIHVLPDGKILVAGLLAYSENSTERRRFLVRLNPDGSLDPTFHGQLGADWSIYAMAVQPDGRILIGGIFNHVHGVPYPTLARLEPDGTLDSTFNPGRGALSQNTPGTVWALALQADGKLLVGGYFDAFGTVAQRGLIRAETTGASGAPQIGNSGRVVLNLNEDTPVEVTLSATDPDGDPLIWSATESNASTTTFAPGANGTVVATYRPAPDFNGPDVLALVATDPDGNADGIGLEATVAPINDAPRFLFPPNISGRRVAGYMLSAGGGYAHDPDWNAYNVSMRWEVADDDNGANATVIPGTVDAPSYMPSSAQIGRYVRLVFVATETGIPNPLSSSAATTWQRITEPMTFSKWQVRQFGADAGVPSISGPQADPDRDGVRNLLEYALGSNPLVPDEEKLPKPKVENHWVSGVTANRLVLGFHPPQSVTDVTYSCAISEDLVNWTESGELLSLRFEDPETIAYLFGDRLPSSTRAKRFIRLQVQVAN